MPYGKSYRNDKAPGTPMAVRRQAATRVSNVMLPLPAVRKSGDPNSHLGHVGKVSHSAR